MEYLNQFLIKLYIQDILLVPLVAFDKNLNRVGYGGGYYDRYIKKIKKKIYYNNWFSLFISKSKKNSNK